MFDYRLLAIVLSNSSRCIKKVSERAAKKKKTSRELQDGRWLTEVRILAFRKARTFFRNKDSIRFVPPPCSFLASTSDGLNHAAWPLTYHGMTLNYALADVGPHQRWLTPLPPINDVSASRQLLEAIARRLV